MTEMGALFWARMRSEFSAKAPSSRRSAGLTWRMRKVSARTIPGKGAYLSFRPARSWKTFSMLTAAM